MATAKYKLATDDTLASVAEALGNITAATGPKGDTGADGGYYKPSVSSAGKLTWTASKTGMASVASFDLKSMVQSMLDSADGVSY